MTEQEYRKRKVIHDASVRSALSHLVHHEAGFATARYGTYHSPHEGLAIIEEEVAEATLELQSLMALSKALCGYVRTDDGARAAAIAEKIQKNAVGLAHEALQAAATAKRYVESARRGEDEFAYAANGEEAEQPHAPEDETGFTRHTNLLRMPDSNRVREAN